MSLRRGLLGSDGIGLSRRVVRNRVISKKRAEKSTRKCTTTVWEGRKNGKRSEEAGDEELRATPVLQAWLGRRRILTETIPSNGLS